MATQAHIGGEEVQGDARHRQEGNKNADVAGVANQRSGMRTHTGNQPPPELNFSKNQKNDLRPDFAHS